MIWFKPYTIKDWEGKDIDTIHKSLGIEITEIGEDTILGRIPIDKRTQQQLGYLHGGASIVLAESLGSIGSAMIINPEKYIVVGQTITANHIRPGIKGWATGKAKTIHIGKRSHIWDIEILSDENKIISTCRLTVAVVKKP